MNETQTFKEADTLVSSLSEGSSYKKCKQMLVCIEVEAMNSVCGRNKETEEGLTKEATSHLLFKRQ